MKYYQSILVTGLLLAGLTSFSQKVVDYAMITHKQSAKKSIITIQVGEQRAEKIGIERDKSEETFDLNGVIPQLKKLNQQGYELFSNAVAAAPYSTSNGPSDLIYTYVLVKRE